MHTLLIQPTPSGHLFMHSENSSFCPSHFIGMATHQKGFVLYNIYFLYKKNYVRQFSDLMQTLFRSLTYPSLQKHPSTQALHFRFGAPHVGSQPPKHSLQTALFSQFFNIAKIRFDLLNTMNYSTVNLYLISELTAELGFYAISNVISDKSCLTKTSFFTSWFTYRVQIVTCGITSSTFNNFFVRTRTW